MKLTSDSEQNVTPETLDRMSKTIAMLNKFSIARLKFILKLLIKDNPKDVTSIKIIKTIIDHKKGRINLMS